MRSSKYRDEYQCSSKTPWIFPHFLCFQHDANTPPSFPQRLVQRFGTAECTDAEPRRVYGTPKRGAKRCKFGGVGLSTDFRWERWGNILNDPNHQDHPKLVDLQIGISPKFSLYTLPNPQIVVVKDGYLQYEVPILNPFI